MLTEFSEKSIKKHRSSVTHSFQKKLHFSTLVPRIRAYALLVFLQLRSFFLLLVPWFLDIFVFMSLISALLTGALEFIYYTSDTSPAELGAYNLSTKSFSRVTTIGQFGSLFGDNIDYNEKTNVLYTSTELLSDDNPMTSGRLISWDQKKVVAINTTYCWAIHANVIAGEILCLSEWPFYNFSSSSSSLSSPLSRKEMYSTRRSFSRSLIKEALLSKQPLYVVSKKRWSSAPPLQQMQFIVSINPTSGATSLVKRDWSDEDVPTNNCETLDRSDSNNPILYV